MKLSPEDAAIARQTLNRVVERALAAAEAGDLEAAITGLMSVRDATVGAAVTLKAISDATRAKALRALEGELA